MTTLLEIKPYIFDYVGKNLNSLFENKVYWLGERKNIPDYPYCLLTIIAENKDKRTSRHFGDLIEVLDSGETEKNTLREKVFTRYKTCTITVGVYNAYIEDTAEEDEDRRSADEFAYAQINNLEFAFEEYPINSLFSVQRISPIRPLPETTDGGYMYRYEFDLTIGYNELITINQKVGNGVDVDLVDTNEIDTEIKNGSVYIDGEDAILNHLDKDYFNNHFKITVTDNDTIIIENNI